MDFKHIMKQPDLGKKIIELRKAKGLTQEELVSICNLNVRTLQRIEAGEVTPRIYTIKTIFAALDFDLHVVQGSNLEGSPDRRLSRWLRQFLWYCKDLFNLKTHTMRKISVLTVLVCALGFGFVTIFSDSNAQSPEKVKEIISDNSKDFMRWFNSKHLDSLVAMYDKDACLVGHGCGEEVVRQYYGAQMLIGYSFKVLEPYSVTVEKSMAVEKGRFTIHFQNGNEMSGEYITEWKKTGKKWLIVSDMANVTNAGGDGDAGNKW